MAMRRAFTRLLPLLLFAPLLAVTEDPRARLDFWKTNYGELRPADDPRAARAYEIFARVLAAAGKRAGVEPRLFIAKGGGAAVPWPSPCPTAASSSPPGPGHLLQGAGHGGRPAGLHLGPRDRPRAQG